MADMMEETLFDVVDRLRRRPSIAEIGGFRPDDGVRSWFGGHFLAEPGARWPELDGSKAIPVLQVKVSELPVVPDLLEGKDIIQVFASAARLPVDLPVRSGHGFVVRELRDTGTLVPATDAPDLHEPRPFQIRWRMGDPEGPGWTEASSYCALDLIDEHLGTEDPIGTYYARYHSHPYTKVGGWASYIQEGGLKPPVRFVLQIASEEKPRWMVRDNGNMYLYIDASGEWLMDYDFY